MDKFVVKQRDFQKDPRNHHQRSDQQLWPAVRFIKKKKEKKTNITNYICKDMMKTYQCATLYTIVTGGTPNGLESGAPNASSNLSC